MELRKRKIQSSEEYSWSDYISLPFTQNVSSQQLWFMEMLQISRFFRFYCRLYVISCLSRLSMKR